MAGLFVHNTHAIVNVLALESILGVSQSDLEKLTYASSDPVLVTVPPSQHGLPFLGKNWEHWEEASSES